MTSERAPPPRTPDPETSAGELALGLLDGEELATALRQFLADPQFARDVDRWRTHFAELFADWPEVTPPDRIFPAIEQALDSPASSASAVSQRGRFWPALAFASTLVAACLALVLIFRPVPPPVTITPPPVQRGPVMIAQLAAPDAEKGAQPVAALYDPATGSIRIGGDSFAGTGKAAELWIIPGDGVPRSMGVLEQAGETPMPVGPHNRPLIAPGATLAVSIEPLGGSPTGKPTGPVVATGLLSLV